jgi:hypothetical protein
MFSYLLQQRSPKALPAPSIKKSSKFVQSVLFVESTLGATRLGERHLGKYLEVKSLVQFGGGRNVSLAGSKPVTSWTT